jgi:hypothetical protein
LNKINDNFDIIHFPFVFSGAGGGGYTCYYSFNFFAA